MMNFMPSSPSAFNLLLPLLLTGLLLSTSSAARERPLWELGVGVATLNAPYYRGSSSSRSYAIPYPYITYRGEYLNVDREGIRGWLYRSDQLNLDLSLAAGLPVPNGQNGPRSGMNKLDPTVEIGPSMEYRLWRSQDRRQNAWLHLPLRSAFVVANPATHQGWVFAPYLEWRRHDFGRSGWTNSIAIGPLFSDSRYNNYFYGVVPEYSTASRPGYEASNGYSGSRLTLMSGKSFDQLWLSAFARFDTLKGATFSDSPLVESRSYHLIGITLTWIFSRSEQTVRVP